MAVLSKKTSGGIALLQQIDVYCINNKAIVLYIAIDILYNAVTRTVIPEERDGLTGSDMKRAGILIRKLESNP